MAKLVSPRALLRATAVLIISVGAFVFAPNPANAQASYNLIRSQYITANPTPGAQSCQHAWVTLATLGTARYYAWDEGDSADGKALVTNNHTFHGKWYWTVCISQFARSTTNYVMKSRLDRCNSDGTSCTTYQLLRYNAPMYFEIDRSGTYEWGSEIWETYANGGGCSGFGGC